MRDLGQSRLARLLYRLHRLLQVCSGGHAALHTYVLVAQPIPKTPPSLRASSQIRCETAGPDSPWVPSFPRPQGVIKKRYEQGATCHVVTKRGVFAGHLWLAHRYYDEDEVRCRYQLPAYPPSTWDYDVYIEPRFRLSRALQYLWGTVNAALDAQGVRWTFSRISLYNAASLSAHERLGASRVGLVHFLVLGPLQISWTPGERRPMVSTPSGKTPILQLQPPDATSVVIGLGNS
ncbi:MAG: hypothetical protein MUF16_28435 [Burkholderiaceae bacterium]|nr:hypothetical protein [Burkholderiaceae bacterium]